MSGKFETPEQRISTLRALLEERILFLDGAMGTSIQGYQLDDAAYRGAEFANHPGQMKGNNDLLTLTKPEVIREIHQSFLEVGADILETNTFNSTSISQADYHLEDPAFVRELNRAGAALAREVADEFTARTPDKPRFVAGILGPTNKTLSLSPDVNDPEIGRAHV